MITFIRRDWGDVVTIVRIVSTDSQAVISTPNYILNQAANIVATNNGEFSWLPNDVVLVSGSDGSAFYQISSNFNSLNALPGSLQQATIQLTAAQD